MILLPLWLAYGLALPAVAQTESEDRGYLQGLLEDNLSGVGREVRITGFEGALSARAAIAELTIADGEGVWLRLSDIVLDWNRAALLRGRIDVNELTVARIDLIRPPVADPSLPAAEASSGFSLPELPVSVQIGQISAARVDIGADFIGQPVGISIDGSATLGDGEGQADLSITRIDGPQGQVQLSGAYANESRQLTLDLAVEEDAGGIAATLLDLPGSPSVRLTVAGDAPIDDFAADLSLATDGQDRLSGQVILQTLREPAPVLQGAPAPAEDAPAAELITRRVVARIGGDIAPVFAPDYRAFFGPDIQLVVTATSTPDGRMLLDGLDLTAAAIRLSGDAALSADGWPERLALSGQIASQEGGAVLLPLSGPQTRVDRADLNLTFDAATGDAWTLRMDIDGLDRPDLTAARAVLTGEGLIRRGDSAEAIGRVTGQFRFDTEALDMTDPAMANALGGDVAGALAFDWSSDGPFLIPRLSLTLADTSLGGSAEIDAGSTDAMGDLSAAFDLRLVTADLSRFAGLAGQPLNGAADLTARGQILPLTGGFRIDLSGQAQDLAIGQPRIDPLITGASRIALQASRDTAGTRVDLFEMTTTGTDLRGRAMLSSSTSTVDLSARLLDAGLILEGVSGPASLTLDARQQAETWQITLDAAAPGQTTARLTGSVSGDGIDSLLAEGQLSAAFGDLRPWSSLAGRPLSGAMQISLDAAGDVLGRSGTASGQVNGTNLALGQANADAILRGDSSLAFEIRQTPEGMTILDKVELRTPQGMTDVTGRISADDSRLRFDAFIRDIGLIAPEVSGQAAARGTVQNSGGDWQIETTATGPGGITAEVAGSLAPDGQQINLTLRGDAPLSLANNRLRPNSVSGLLSYDLAVNGPPALSSVSGVLSTQGARIVLPGAGLALSDLQATLRLSGGRAQVDAGAALTSGGRIALSGPITLSAPFPADLTIDLSRAVFSQRNLYEATADGQVTLRGPLTGGAQIGGRIALDMVELRIPESRGPTFANLPELDHRGENAAVRQTRIWAGLIADPTATSGPSVAFPIDLIIDAPSRIFVRGRGLDAELGGRLRLTGTTAALVPQGQFELVRGRLNILGKRLDLTEGLVRLQGAFDPYLRFIAETEAQGSAIRIGLEGVASQPELTLTSSPELPQDEVLALLLFGRGITDISALQAVQLAGAIRTLSGKSNGLSEGLRNSIGVDDLDLSTTEDGQTEARVGKYISENIYTDVTVNTAGETEINLNLNVTRSITVRGRLGSDGGTGIGVYIERDY
ncbi:translocation/assembly module TamB domain-containing protein [Seohaeicola saemankumensis]|uniref:Translocation/assembly module TamB domain-containing protein n=1 Tax=Seohaeicola saemankumensis TaxID=481181 RepID=A0ABW3TFJ4_9RHOB